MKFIDILVLIILYFICFYKKWLSKGTKTLFINTIFYIYITGVLYFTLMPVITNLPFIFNHPYGHMNMNLFADLKFGRGDFVRQLVLNVIMMIPFGFLFPLVKKQKCNFIITILSAFLFSLSIELLQPLINASRSSDITDLVTNNIGSIIGYLIYLLILPILKRIKYHL